MRVEREEEEKKKNTHLHGCNLQRFQSPERGREKKRLASSESLIIGSEYLRLNREDT